MKLGELMAQRTGSVDPVKYPNEDFDLYSIPAFDSGRPDHVRGEQIGSSKQIVKPGDVLLSKIVPHIRRSWIVGKKGERRQIASGEWIVFRDEKVHGPYLRQLLISEAFHREFMQTVSGVGGSLLRARPAQVAEIEVPMPTLSEQRRIAEILDRADALCRKRQQTLELTDAFLRATFLDLFGDPASNSKGWSVEPVGAVTGCIVPGRDKPKSFTGSIPWVTTEDLKRLGVTTVSGKSLALSEAEIGQVRAKVVPPHSVLLCCAGDVGKLSLTSNKMVINQQLHAFLPGELIRPAFLMFALDWQRPYMLQQASSTTIAYMNKGVCNGIPVIVPPLNLQEKFEGCFDGVQRILRRMRDAEQDIEHIVRSLSKKLFSG